MAELITKIDEFADWLSAQGELEPSDVGRVKITNAAKLLRQEAFKLAQSIVSFPENVVKQQARTTSAGLSCVEMLTSIRSRLPLSLTMDQQAESLINRLQSIQSADLRSLSAYCASETEISFLASSAQLLSSVPSLGEPEQKDRAILAIKSIQKSLRNDSDRLLVSPKSLQIQELESLFVDVRDFVRELPSKISVSSTTASDFLNLVRQIEGSVLDRISNVTVKQGTLRLADIQVRLTNIESQLEADIAGLNALVQSLTFFANLISVISRILSLAL